jgi:regulator of replication initiation timing
MGLKKFESEANADIENLRAKCSEVVAKNDMYRLQYEDLKKAYDEKQKTLAHVQNLYDRVKRTSELGQLQQAAFDAVDKTVREADMSNASHGLRRHPHVRDLDSLPQVPLFRGIHSGDNRSNSLSHGGQQIGGTRNNQPSPWPKQGITEHCEWR